MPNADKAEPPSGSTETSPRLARRTTALGIVCTLLLLVVFSAALLTALEMQAWAYCLGLGLLVLVCLLAFGRFVGF
jgi:hypothetical protein